MKSMRDRQARPHLEVYQARTRRPLAAFPLIGDGPSRVIPGGALVTITENTDPVTENHERGVTVRTATAYLDGEPFECEIRPEQFTPYPDIDLTTSQGT